MKAPEYIYFKVKLAARLGNFKAQIIFCACKMNYTWIRSSSEMNKSHFILPLPSAFYSNFYYENLNVCKNRESSLLTLKVQLAASKITNFWPILCYLYTPYIFLLKPQFILKQFSGIISIHL